jgi:hypothetical protein
MAIDFIAEERREARQAVKDFVRGAATGDLDLLAAALPALDSMDYAGGGWRRAFIAISKAALSHPRTKDFFATVWFEDGEHIRQETGDDLALVDGLRFLLPSYSGPSLRLFRGDGFQNRRRRTYGLSWTTDRETALRFAEKGMWRHTVGGSVLLEATAGPMAIVASLADRYGEQEYLVDRRKLGIVRVVEQFTQISIAART